MIPGLKLRGSSHKPPTPSTWRRLVHECRARFPLAIKVRVSRGPRPKWAGDDWEAGTLISSYTDGSSVAHVWICEKSSRLVATEALLHEWAHLLCEEEGPSTDGFLHGDRFWITYGKLYRTWHRET